MVVGNELRLADGRIARGTLGVMSVMDYMLRHGSIRANMRDSNVTTVHVHRLRDLLRTSKLPFAIVTERNRGRYILKRLTE